jgi:lipoprotein-anchoring transpeptidase ErfK/SrfK
VSDELTSQLKELAQKGETPPPVPGAQIRLRAVRRRRRRRTAAAVAGACAATALALVHALNLGGGDSTDRHQPPATRPTGTPTTPAAPDATVDLSRRVLTAAGRTLPISSGTEPLPTPTGRMKVTAKEAAKVVPASNVGVQNDAYTVKLPWVIELASTDGSATTFIGALTYDEKAPGAYDRTDGWIGLRPKDAKWLYGQLRLGAVVDIEGATPTATPESEISAQVSAGTTGG